MSNRAVEKEEQPEVEDEKRIEVRRKREIIFGLLILLGVIGVAFTGGWYLLRGPSEERPGSDQTAIFTISGVNVRDPSDGDHLGVLAPDFSLTDPKGDVSWISNFTGQVVVIDFMATWCSACRLQTSHLNVIWENYDDKIALISVDIDPSGSKESLSSYAQSFQNATWIWARDTANLAQAYQVSAIPKTAIIDQDGYIRFTHVDVTPASTLVGELDQLFS